MSSKPRILGPWKEHIDEYGQLFIVQTDENGEGVKRIICVIGDLEELGGQDFAEAHAIAALPELLVACEAMAKALGEETSDYVDAMFGAAIKAKEAVEKVRGEA